MLHFMVDISSGCRLANVEVSDGWPYCSFRTGNAMLGQPFAPPKSWASSLGVLPIRESRNAGGSAIRKNNLESHQIRCVKLRASPEIYVNLAIVRMHPLIPNNLLWVGAFRPPIGVRHYRECVRLPVTGRSGDSFVREHAQNDAML